MKAILTALLFLSASTTWGQGFSKHALGDSIFACMQGKSYPRDCTTPREDLCYLHILHYNEQGEVMQGELICHKSIADDLLEIFEQLYKARYVIARMKLIDQYNADDQRSMAANNTSCFNFRYVSGTRTVSKHGWGMAIDINPLYNPYMRVRDGKIMVEPLQGKPYAYKRDKRKYPQMIGRSDLCYRLFIQHGFRWGGAWKHSKDYQHFEK